ncbi:manganese efflux pump MntP [Chitinasiproducens palmae]|uniref:Putative manganese efflux pump MntP n=1 Tax=Chitinasiproducens palmae TaxID=1770053 RepID=A0A1H2PMM9_9BURK|nr:manganese efflux pump MntP [Chitinasiproducens palmae]SDV47775.1 Putative Mn2+ efflux pump MntP [Chitinasiproducens palmae]
MNLLSTFMLAFAMSTDAFAASIGKGAALHRPCLREALRTGLIFGVIEALTPLLGWAIGLAAARYVARWDHWIAFSLLGVLGLRMIYSGLARARADDDPAARPGRHSFWVLALTAFATSIDALTVGVGLAFVDVDILRTAVAIGTATMIMATTGIMLGRMLGSRIGRGAEIGGGVMLIGIGATILAQHLHPF